MASVLPRAAFRASRRLLDQAGARQDQAASGKAMQAEAKRNPELFVLLPIVAGVFGVAGWYFTSNPTGASQEKSVVKVEGSEPWKTGKQAPYQYHPYGDTTETKDAPSPLHVSIIPNVNLPKELHDRFNKYGKDGYP